MDLTKCEPHSTIIIFSQAKNSARTRLLATRSSALAETVWCFMPLNILLSHSMSFKITPLSSEYVSPIEHFIELKLCLYLVPFLRYSASNNGTTLSGAKGHSRSLKMVQFDRSYMTYYLSAIFKYSCILYHFSSYLTLNNIVILKSGLGVTQGHWKWYYSRRHISARRLRAKPS